MSLDAIAEQIERLDMLCESLRLPIPHYIHTEDLRQALPEVTQNLKAAYLAAGGTDYWSTHPAAAPSPECAPAVRAVLAERQRQIEVEGWSPEHDDEYKSGELAWAAACYAMQSTGQFVRYRNGIPTNWPWDAQWWKPKNPLRDLERAAALLLAEIERRHRQQARAALAGREKP